jgi:hypothetical protein
LISDFDQALEKIVPEDILLEPPKADIPTICSKVPDGGLLLPESAGQEVTRVVSRASSTLEGSLPCKNADPSHPTPMEVAEGPSALEVVAAEGPAPEGGAGGDPAPEGVTGSSLAPRVVLVVIQPPRVLEHALSLLLPWRSTLDRLSLVRGGGGDTRFYGFHWSSRFRGQRARHQGPAACWWNRSYPESCP